MANNPRKVKDPTEVALSAIQEALNIADVPPNQIERTNRLDTAEQLRSDAGASADDEHSLPPPLERQLPSLDDYTPADRIDVERIQPARDDEQPTFTRRAANDDRETIGQLLQAIQKGHPARSAYVTATIFAGLWLASMAVLTVLFLSSL
jgi:hypothetical protein